MTTAALERPRLVPPRLTKLARALEASVLVESLAAFARAAWHVLEPGSRLVWDWPLDAICAHLEAVTDGRITRLLINVPPGCMKSLLVSVIWPAWEWALQERRHLRFIGTSHKQDLAVRDNLKCRRLIQSTWYQERWPLVLTSDQNAKTKFENAETGFREAMSFTSMTGSRGDRVILDDPLSVDDALSEAEILSAKTTFLESLPTRVNNESSAIVVIMQRLHENDPSGIILEKKLPYVHLMLPMRFEPERRCRTPIGFVDPRKKDGELLFPARFSEKGVRELETVLGEYGTAGQLQQRPTPRGGGLFKRKFLNLWPAGKELPDMEFVLQSYDTAFTEKTANDPTACSVWGVWTRHADGKKCVMLLDSWDDNLQYPALRKRVLKDWKIKYGGRPADQLHPPRRADLILVEDKGSGISLVQDMRAAGLPVHSYNPGKADKYARAQMSLPLYEQDIVYVLESVKRPGEVISWAEAFVRQLTNFGHKVAAHDDYVDTFTQTIIYLRDAGMLELPVNEEDEEETANYGPSPRNPYS
jgi:predicted phage terminase large subunit-like protein